MNETTDKMIILDIPQDQTILAALGVLSIRHGQLEYILRMTIKSLTNISIKKALDATSRQSPTELRKRINKLATQQLGEGTHLLKLQALLERSRQVSDKRNELIHNLWAHELDGLPVQRTENHEWKAIPTIVEREELSHTLVNITKEINTARFRGGFLFDAFAKKAKK